MGLPVVESIIPPLNGWEERTFYLVEIAWTKHNPIHKALFYTGFLHGDEPGNYAGTFNPTYEPEFFPWRSRRPYYMKVIKRVVHEDEFKD